MDPGGAGLEGEAGAEHLQPQRCDLRHHRGVVAIPPAAPHVQVPELARHDRGLVLVPAAEHRGHELDLRVAPAELGQGSELRGADAVARHPQLGTHTSLCAHAQRQWEPRASAQGKDNQVEHLLRSRWLLRAAAVKRRIQELLLRRARELLIAECMRRSCCQENGLQGLQATLQKLSRPAQGARLPGLFERVANRRPVALQQLVQSERAAVPWRLRRRFEARGRLPGIEGIVARHHVAQPCQAHHLLVEHLLVLTLVPCSDGLQVTRRNLLPQTQGVQSGQDSTARL
mmetsp:Transcript_5185/g.12748  ORF Transcript_5185/g.12748 Transcript_5185/m.12748 type:complete len:287 (+) Transcript_5185:560-1420(+)